MSYFGMSKLTLKSALRRPATRGYPFEARRIIPDSRGLLVFAKANCVYCSVCRKKCPTGAIGVNRNQKKWAIDRLRCISCGYCVEACPKHCLSLSTEMAAPTVTKDRDVY
jgi:formate hydrogenlyase subunit 6/NADH:ubiquinone oxidoreductase subunit I